MSNFFKHESSYVDEGCQIGNGTKIWHFSHIMSNCTIGENCNIGQNVVISPKVVLGNNVKIQNNVSVYEGVIAEDDVFMGPSMVFTNVLNPRSHVSRKDEYRATILRRGCSIGANATIVCGHEIGEFALIGAGTVVTKESLYEDKRYRCKYFYVCYSFRYTLFFLGFLGFFFLFFCKSLFLLLFSECLANLACFFFAHCANTLFLFCRKYFKL